LPGWRRRPSQQVECSGLVERLATTKVKSDLRLSGIASSEFTDTCAGENTLSALLIVELDVAIRAASSGLELE
jgi:hypothetical protein